MGLLVPGCCTRCSVSFPALGVGARSCLYGHSQQHHEPHPVPPALAPRVLPGAGRCRHAQPPGSQAAGPSTRDLLQISSPQLPAALGWRGAQILHLLGTGARTGVDEAAHGQAPHSPIAPHGEPPPQGDGALPRPAVQVRLRWPLGAEGNVNICSRLRRCQPESGDEILAVQMPC